VSSHEWSLDLESEVAYLLPFYLREPDPEVKRQVEEFIALLVTSPVGRGSQDAPDVFHAHAGRTGVVVVWLLNPEDRTVVLAAVERG